MTAETVARAGHRLRFSSPSGKAPALSFPCDAQGRVDIAALDRRSLVDYLYARALVGRQFLAPSVLRAP